MNVRITELFVGKMVEILILMMFTDNRIGFMFPSVTVRLSTNNNNTKISPAIAMGMIINKYTLEQCLH